MQVEQYRPRQGNSFAVLLYSPLSKQPGFSLTAWWNQIVGRTGARRTARADPDPRKSQAASSSRRLTPTSTRGGAARGNIKSEVPLGLHGRVPSASRVAAVVQIGCDPVSTRLTTNGKISTNPCLTSMYHTFMTHLINSSISLENVNRWQIMF